MESIVIAIEMFVSTFIEKKDRRNKNLASRNILSLKNLKIMNIEANDIFHDLHPLFPNTEAENYYSIPISTTGYFPKDEAFKTIIHLPQMRSTDVFQTILHSSSFVTLRSDYFQTHLVHSDMHDCFETSSDRTVCIKRICNLVVPSSPSIIHSCVVHQEKYVEIVFNKTSDYK